MDPLAALFPFEPGHALGMLAVSYMRDKAWPSGKILLMAEIMIPDTQITDYLVNPLARLELSVAVTEYIREWGMGIFDVSNEAIMLYTRVEAEVRIGLTQQELNNIQGLKFLTVMPQTLVPKLSTSGQLPSNRGMAQLWRNLHGLYF